MKADTSVTSDRSADVCQHGIHIQFSVKLDLEKRSSPNLKQVCAQRPAYLCGLVACATSLHLLLDKAQAMLRSSLMKNPHDSPLPLKAGFQ